MDRRTPWVAGWAIVTVALAAAAVAGARSGEARIALNHPLPSVVRVHERVAVAGDVTGGGGSERVALQSQPVQPSNALGWTTMARGRVSRHGTFRLHWHVRASAFNVIRLRVAIVRGGQVVDITGTRTTSIGPARVACKPPPVLNALLPRGVGRVVGGVYIVGGPAPGVDQCESGTHTVVVKDGTGAVVARQTVRHRHSYAFVLRAGTYTLSLAEAPGCRGTARVTAGRTTRADVTCDVP